MISVVAKPLVSLDTELLVDILSINQGPRAHFPESSAATLSHAMERPLRVTHFRALSGWNWPDPAGPGEPPVLTHAVSRD